MLDFIERLNSFEKSNAIIDSNNNNLTYRGLLEKSEKIASLLLKDEADLTEKPIPFIINPGINFVCTLFGIWRAGGIAVPLCNSHPVPEWEYVLNDISAEIIIFEPEFEDKIALLKTSIAKQNNIFKEINTDSYSNLNNNCSLPEIEEKRRALIIYTSGSTGRPKGVVTTHFNISSQIKSLVEAWYWSENDFILNVLPLHHVHGLVNILLCSLWSGAKCMMHSKFNAKNVWQKLITEELTLFMAVPTIYNKLIDFYSNADQEFKESVKLGLKSFRLMVSGSAALPITILEKWNSISGLFLLERYGMTEIGMALSNSYSQERIPGHVGKPLPGVEVLILNDKGDIMENDEEGELLVRGGNIFLEYWNKDEATQKAFNNDWFITGDIVKVNENGYFQIVGRRSVDIIKTGGYKVSALEIEEVLRDNNEIKECAVVGIPNEEWGQIVCAMIVLKHGSRFDEESLTKWAKTELASYKVPSKFEVVEDIPKNAMGKVVKPQVIKFFKNIK